MNNNLEKYGDELINETLAFIKENINWKITEHDLLQFINGKIQMNNFDLNVKNNVSFEENIRDKNYFPNPDNSKIIRKKGKIKLELYLSEKETKSVHIIKEIMIENL